MESGNATPVSKEKCSSEEEGKEEIIEIEEHPLPPPFTIASYNICFGWSGQDEESLQIYNAIEECNADIVCLQETHKRYEKEIKKRFRAKYPYQIFHQPSRYLASGCGILSRFRMKEVFFGFAKDHGRRVEGSIFRQQIVEVGSMKIPVVNFHLRPGTALGKGLFKQIKAWIYETDKIRLLEFLSFHEKIKELGYDQNDTLFVGDFNEGKFGSTVKYLRRNGFYDAIENEKTWFWPVFLINASGSLDHIFFSTSRYKSIEKKVYKKYKLVSDHLPVSAKIMFLDEKEKTEKMKEKVEVEDVEIKEKCRPFSEKETEMEILENMDI